MVARLLSLGVAAAAGAAFVAGGSSGCGSGAGADTVVSAAPDVTAAVIAADGCRWTVTAGRCNAAAKAFSNVEWVAGRRARARYDGVKERDTAKEEKRDWIAMEWTRNMGIVRTVMRHLETHSD